METPHFPLLLRRAGRKIFYRRTRHEKYKIFTMSYSFTCYKKYLHIILYTNLLSI